MRKKVSRALALFFVPFLGALIIRLLYLTNKKVYHSPESLPKEPLIFACWHGELLMLPYLYSHYRKQPRAKVLISPHFDGKLISKTISYFGLETLAGSSDKSPAKVLIQAIRTLKDGYDIGITPDGPKGPRHKAADGVVVMAQKANVKVVLVRIQPTKFWQFNSWDRFTVPKPFGTIHYYATQPLDLSSMDLDEAREFVEQGLLHYEH